VEKINEAWLGVFSGVGMRDMPRKKPKLRVLSDRIADARRIIDTQQALLEKLRVSGQPRLARDSQEAKSRNGKPNPSLPDGTWMAYPIVNRRAG
jgi:hypothetical protein